MDPERWSRVEDLYRSALERPPEDRAEFLREACADSELLREVQSLLHGHDHPGPPPSWPESECLSNGARLGAYEILGVIGAGGMGTVYRARDTRLDRIVAIKICREHFGGRFEREARAISALNHPHICTLHDVGSEGGIDYLVMEHLAGETLAQRISQGPLPLDQALRVAVQIGGALDCAHRAGVTHRDVKPANILLTRDGAKVLDFGLATATGYRGTGNAAETITLEGTILGTPQYMAPEQVEGKQADARSDIWAFGVVLYEMVTGKRPFDRKSAALEAAAIVSSDPPPMEVKPSTPPALERLVRRCLQRDPENRWQSMRDVVLELETPAPEIAGHVPPRRPWPWVVAALCLVVAALAFWDSWVRTSASPALPATLEVMPPEGARFAAITPMGGSAISPDGRTLAFVAANSSGVRLYVRSLDSGQAHPLPGTEDAGRPFWSPDSKSLGFVAGGKLKRIDLASASLTILCDSSSPRGGTWSADGVILFGTPETGIQRVAASGGTRSSVTTVNKDAGEAFHYYPQFLPGGKKFLYLSRHSEQQKMGIFVGSLDGQRPIRIQQTEYKALYEPATQRLLYIGGTGTLMASKMKLDPPELSGDPLVVAEEIRLAVVNGYAEFSVSGNGILFYGRESGDAKGRFAWRDRAGKLLETVGQIVEAVVYPRMSPEGGRVAYTSDAPGRNGIWILDLARGLNTRITSGSGRSPQWSPGGERLYYSNPSGIHSKASDGTGSEERLLPSGPNEFVFDVSPDGKRLLYGATDILQLPLTGEIKPSEYLKTQFGESFATFSPDGRWVAYDSNESGQMEVYVRGFPDHRGKWPVSLEGGTNSRWRADGKEIYWIGRDSMLMAAGVELAANTVRIKQPEKLFRVAQRTGYVPARDGRRFLTFEPEAGSQRDRPMEVRINWASQLVK